MPSCGGRFFVYPEHPRYKDRWECYGWPTRGDAHDFLRLFGCVTDYNARRELLAQAERQLRSLRAARRGGAKFKTKGEANDL